MRIKFWNKYNRVVYSQYTLFDAPFLNKSELLAPMQVMSLESRYPEVYVKNYQNYPKVVFLYGNISILGNTGRCLVGITGSRIVDGRVIRVINNVCTYIISKGLIPVLGGAVGCDSVLFKKLIGRVPLIIIRPALENYWLEVCKRNRNVLLVTLKPGMQFVKPQDFLRRNTVMSVLIKRAILLKGDVRSGSLNTARTVLKMGKDLFVNSEFANSNIGYSGNRELLESGHKNIYELGNFIINV